ncbi:MAG: ribosome biogenesis GTPase Der [Wenzhouxiangellaceae bacterium]|nr:ribosome biogenesis GTPase Der [Wenzhouxiangellaceae bacterium]
MARDGRDGLAPAMDPDVLPVVVIAGRPNVGKSTLFNALTRTRAALVADEPGVTRDRIYGRARLDGRDIVLVDTGGLNPDPDKITAGAGRQTRLALAEADVIVLVVDGRGSAAGEDFEIAGEIRQLGKPVVLAVNKTDGIDADAALAEFAVLGLGETVAIAAAHRRGLERLGDLVGARLPEPAADDREPGTGERIRLALIGRPNVGKSTLLNRLLGDERAVTADLPGTTRDPVAAALERDGRDYELVDTAGIRRRRHKHEKIESLSTLKAMQAMENADVVCLLLDATEGVTDQDARLAGHVIEAGRGLVVVLNKWDGLDERSRQRCLEEAGERLRFVSWAPVVIASALHGSGLGELFDAIETVYDSACRSLPSGRLSRVLADAVQAHSPPMVQRFAAKLRYAHAGGNFPTRIVIHGNRTRHVPDAYRRYLVNRFRSEFDLIGVPVQLVFRDSENPYAGRRNKLTPRQVKRRKRVRKRHG